MKDQSKTKQELIAELASLRKRIAEYEQTEAHSKSSENELHDSEQRLHCLADNLTNAVAYQLTAEPEGGRRFTYISRAVERMNEVTVEEVLADANVIYKQVLPEYLGLLKQREEEAMKNMSIVHIELQSRLPSGRLRWFEYSSTPRYQSDGLLVWDGVQVDITERKQMEKKLRDTLSFLHTLFNTIPSPIFCKDINGTYVDCNNEFEKYVGLERKDIIGKSVYEIHSQDVADMYHEMDLALLSHPGRQVYEYPILYADGNRHDVVVNKATYLNADGAAAGLVGVMVDITEHKQAEDALAKYREELEQLVSERTQELENRTKTLEEVNVAMKVLLQHREDDKKDLEDRFVMNIKNLIMPYAEKLKSTRLDERQLAYLDIMEANLTDITSSMIKKMHQFHFTPTEIEVTSLIKEGKSTKEIATIIGIAKSSIDTHRNNIRKKLGISLEKVNLRSYLQSFD